MGKCSGKMFLSEPLTNKMTDVASPTALTYRQRGGTGYTPYNTDLSYIIVPSQC